MNQTELNVTLPEGVSLQCVGQVLLNAWEVGSHQWTNTPIQLREGPIPTPLTPVPQDAIELFRVLNERQVPYLLVGGMAMLTYVRGRNTKDVDLLMSAAAMQLMPELKIEDRNDCFVRAHFRSVQVDLLLTTNPLFKTVEERFATSHPFEELTVPAATVEGLIVLKLFALPFLYRQLDWDRVSLYEADIKQLLARYKSDVQPLLALVEPHVLPGDIKELRNFIAEQQQRIDRANEKYGSGQT